MLFEQIKLEEDEQILLVVRRHWFVFLMKMLSIVFIAVLPFLALIITSLHPTIGTMVTTAYTNYSDPMLFFLALWLLFSWMQMAHIWTDQYLDLWVITDRRVVSIDQKNLFVRTVGSFRLERLQDMSIIIPGFLATMLDYGHIDAQTAGHGGNDFHVRNLPKPREIKSIILEAADRRMKQSYGTERIIEGTE